MKTTKISLSLAVIMFAGALAFTSCKKKDKTAAQEPDSEQSSASDNALAENSSNDIVSMGSQVSENSGTLTTFRSNDATANNELMLAGSCATIAAGLTGTVVTSYTVDFGTVATCTGQDGRIRTGKLIYDFTGSPANARYRTPGFKMAVSSVNYVVDGNAISVTKTVTNTSPLSIATQTAYAIGYNLTWNISASLSIVKANNGGTITWACNRTKELLNSNDPNCYKGQFIAIDWKKAIIKLNGSASGTNNKGESYTAVATNLVRDFNCVPDLTRPHKHPFTSGTIDYTPGARALRHIDYGSGTVYPNAACDFNATVTINGQTYAITLP